MLQGITTIQTGPENPVLTKVTAQLSVLLVPEMVTNHSSNGSSGPWQQQQWHQLAPSKTASAAATAAMATATAAAGVLRLGTPGPILSIPARRTSSLWQQQQQRFLQKPRMAMAAAAAKVISSHPFNPPRRLPAVTLTCLTLQKMNH